MTEKVEKYVMPPWLEKILGPADTRAAAENKAKEKVRSPNLPERFKKRINRWLGRPMSLPERPGTSGFKYSQKQLKKLEEE